jgi:SAM-dependent methyltransferase
MRNYCTLFDKNYASRGLALYESLIKQSDVEFTLYILPMDEETKSLLLDYNGPNIVILNYDEFEDDELGKVKKIRGRAEFCWTCTPSLIKYCIENYELESCTYLDADIYFFSSPELLFEEVTEDVSILLTKHNYTPEHNQENESGIYCVQFMFFRNDRYGKEALTWWRDACLEKCELDAANGYCGDQGYLNDWTERFEKVHVLNHIGGGVAPWNIENYKITCHDNQTVVSNHNNVNVVFYHYHALKLGDVFYVPSGSRYKMSFSDLKHIYYPYISHLRIIKEKMSLERKGWGLVDIKTNMTSKLKRLVKNCINKNYNCLDLVSNTIAVDSCPICFDKNITLIYDGLYDDRYAYPLSFPIFGCSTCKHKFLKDDFSDKDLTYLYSNFYPRRHFSLDDFSPVTVSHGFSLWWNGEKSSAYTYVPKNTKVLDVGCGFGQTLAFHKSRGCDVYGVDADSNLERVADRHNFKVEIGIFNKNSFKSEKFNYITIDQVLEHAVDPLGMLKNATGKLIEGGRLIISTPNSEGLGRKLFGKSWIHWHNPYHINIFSKKSMDELAQRLGLTVVSHQTVTHSNWLYYQLVHCLTMPKISEESVFWGNEKKTTLTKMKMIVPYILHKIGVTHFISRLIDFVGQGDSQIMILEKKNE